MNKYGLLIWIVSVIVFGAIFQLVRWDAPWYIPFTVGWLVGIATVIGGQLIDNLRNAPTEDEEEE